MDTVISVGLCLVSWGTHPWNDTLSFWIHSVTNVVFLCVQIVAFVIF